MDWTALDNEDMGIDRRVSVIICITLYLCTNRSRKSVAATDWAVRRSNHLKFLLKATRSPCCFVFHVRLFAVDRKLVALHIGQVRRPMNLGGIDTRLLHRMLLRELFQKALFGSNKVDSINNLTITETE